MENAGALRPPGHLGVLREGRPPHAPAGGRIAIEWPKSCLYWSWKQAQALIDELGLVEYELHGCAFRTKDEQGRLVYKPWIIATNDKVLGSALASHKCTHTAPHPGKTGKSTENYNPAMAKVIHNAWRSSVHNSRPKGVACCCIPQMPLGAAAVPSQYGICEFPDQVDIYTPGSVGLSGSAATRANSPGGGFTCAVPAVPVVNEYSGEPPQEHRPRRGPWPLFNAAVARTLTRKEIALRPDAQAAVKLEGDTLAGKEVWQLSGVQEKREVLAECGKMNKKAHFADVFGICVEKGSELPMGDPKRYCKGRYVFAGDRVRDERGGTALFNELSSNPATLESSRATDAYGLLPGHVGQQSDAEQAYAQAQLGARLGDVECGNAPSATETWVTLADELVPEERGRILGEALH